MIYSKIKKKHQITLPAKLIKKFHLAIGDIIEFVEKGREIVLRPKKLIDAEETWFWNKTWQEKEKEAEHDIKTGKIHSFDTVEEMIEDLNK